MTCLEGPQIYLTLFLKALFVSTLVNLDVGVLCSIIGTKKKMLLLSWKKFKSTFQITLINISKNYNQIYYINTQDTDEVVSYNMILNYEQYQSTI